MDIDFVEEGCGLMKSETVVMGMEAALRGRYYKRRLNCSPQFQTWRGRLLLPEKVIVFGSQENQQETIPRGSSYTKKSKNKTRKQRLNV